MAVFLACHAVHFLVCPSTDYTGAGQAAANVCPDEITQEGVCVWGGEGPGRAVSYKKKKPKTGAQPSLSSSLPPDSFLLSCSGPYESSQYRESEQANKWAGVCVHEFMRTKAGKSKNTNVCVGGENYHGEKTCSDFLHQNLGRRSEEEKLLLEGTLPLHTHAYTFLHPPPHSSFSNFMRKLHPTVTSSFQSHN